MRWLLAHSYRLKRNGIELHNSYLPKTRYKISQERSDKWPNQHENGLPMDIQELKPFRNRIDQTLTQARLRLCNKQDMGHDQAQNCGAHIDAEASQCDRSRSQ